MKMKLLQTEPKQLYSQMDMRDLCWDHRDLRTKSILCAMAIGLRLVTTISSEHVTYCVYNNPMCYLYIAAALVALLKNVDHLQLLNEYSLYRRINVNS
jgi:hypothetical protein